MTEVLINEWVSLWDHWTIWGLSLHHSCKFLSHLRNLQPAMRNLVPFLWSERNIFTFILTNSIKAADLQKSIRSGSYLTTQHRLLNLLQRSNLGVFQQRSGDSSVGISRYLLTGWVFPWLSVNQPLSVSYNWEGVFLGILQPSPTQCLDCGWAPVFFNWVPPLGTFKWEGARTCYTPPNKTQDLQPIWEILEPEETQSNLSELPRRWMGTRGLCWYQGYRSS